MEAVYTALIIDAAAAGLVSWSQSAGRMGRDTTTEKLASREEGESEGNPSCGVAKTPPPPFPRDIKTGPSSTAEWGLHKNTFK